MPINPENFQELPSYDVLMISNLKALKALGGRGSVEEIDSFILSQDEFIKPHSQIWLSNYTLRKKLILKLAWARTYLKKAGLIVNSNRGFWEFKNVESMNTDFQNISKENFKEFLVLKSDLGEWKNHILNNHKFFESTNIWNLVNKIEKKRNIKDATEEIFVQWEKVFIELAKGD